MTNETGADICINSGHAISEYADFGWSISVIRVAELELPLYCKMNKQYQILYIWSVQ